MYVLLYIYTGDFRKAVCICGGEDITTSVIDAVYTIFDVDGDGHLSTEEFISIMKSRLKRGLRVCFILCVTVYNSIKLFISMVNEYPTMHYVGIPSHSQLKSYMPSLTEYFWKFQ